VQTIWVLGDQLNRDIGAMARASPDDTRVLLVESRASVEGRRWHRQRLHLVLASMRRFAGELRDAGFAVDHRVAPSMAEGVRAHVDEHDPDELVATEANSWDGRLLQQRLDVATVASDQFLCHHDHFATWAGDRTSLRMEDFYRWHRGALGYLMDGDQPAGGQWNFDHDNREPPPTDGRDWPRPQQSRLDDLDADVVDGLPPGTWGRDPVGWWPTSRRMALARLRHAIDEVLPRFGPHEDAMLADSWHMAHTLLSPALNLGLLLPGEVADAIETAHRAGDVPIASAEGLLRQVIGWREFVWGMYWRSMPDYRDVNELGATRPLPPVLRGTDTGTLDTDMACVRITMAGLHDHGWTHHIQRLMVLGNLCLLAGVEPSQVSDWMGETFVDGAEWVMLPNVQGMALYADGGVLATKPYASGGAYIDRMSDYCTDCRFDRRQRVGDDACPFTTLYWDFIARHRDRWAKNHRMSRIVGNLDRLRDADEIPARAAEVLGRLDDGTL